MLYHKRKQFGLLLKNLRNDRGWNQDKLAEELDVSRQTIANTERGQNVPKAKFVEHAFQLFGSEELIRHYISIQEDRKELMALADAVVSDQYHPVINSVMKQVIKESLKTNDLHAIFSTLFQMIMWELKFKGKVNRRKNDWLIKVTQYLDPDPEAFFEMIEKLYHHSRESSNFSAFITITEGIKCKVTLGNSRLSQILCYQANAYFYSGNIRKAYKVSSKALDTMNGEVYKHTAFAYHRHALICMQQIEFEEALEAELVSLSLLKPTEYHHSIVKAGLARLYYMNGDYGKANEYWEDVFTKYDVLDPARAHSLNDMIMMEIKLGNLEQAHAKIVECDRLLDRAKKNKWPHYDVESMLLRRNKIMLEAVETGNFLSPEVGNILQELNNSYLRDERELTKNFVLERMFLSSRI
ncbi:helix-turn-helix domain-containing protein [Brevibacillus sp. HB2.2]|uniref:helix-turn-helix domain-containing protein n=1 Tax=Brevibacillus sp. HB2.2 TaxID=2738846 RepID=UPI00156B6018|nr:helix-turn-helix transcriptional regulator [Brevibacillus sp. HB2.2]NRS51014.1 helix-turn-helix transcriptional regulator [Brevibacillus sp. HB2.2]